jgi:hypothetical protein
MRLHLIKHMTPKHVKATFLKIRTNFSLTRSIFIREKLLVLTKSPINNANRLSILRESLIFGVIFNNMTKKL